MNIIITLPIELIAEIAEGRKQVEIRKFIPHNFNMNHDVVWVKTKGRDKVPMSFEISYFDEESDIEVVWRRYKDLIRVPFAWYQQYVGNSRKITIWHIKRVHMFMPNLCFSKTFPGKKAPQSFIYTDVTLQSVMCLVKSVTCYETDGETRREVSRKKAIQ